MAENSQKTTRRRGPGRPFKPGQSGNPGGRPLEAVHIRDLARQRTAKALTILENIMCRGKTEAARVRAAEVLLDRGWGRPGQPLDIVSDTTLRITVEGNEHLQPRRERPAPPLPLDTP